jgi:hypothetical protein
VSSCVRHGCNPLERFPANCKHLSDEGSNGNNNESKANVSFDNGIFFGIEAMRKCSIAKKFILSEANTFDYGKKIVFKEKRTRSIVRNLFSKQSEHVRQKENYFRSEANTFDSKKISYEAKRIRSAVRQIFPKQSEES